MSKENDKIKTQTPLKEEQATPPKKFKWKPIYFAWLLTVISLLVGGFGLYQRFSLELRMTDLGSFVPWGLWVATYEYMVWLEVGLITVYTLLVHVFKVDFNIPKLARTLYVSALAILVMALILIGLDLGHPFRFVNVFIHPHWGSLMTWMIWLHIIYLVVLLVKIIVEGRSQTQSSHKLAAWLSYISLPLGVALVVVAGSVFGVALGRPAWQGSALPIYFLLSALVAGTALLAFQFIWFFPEEHNTTKVANARLLGKILLGMLITILIAAALMGLVILYPGVPAQVAALRLTIFGPFWWLYWIFHILLGVILPIGLLLTHTKTARRIGVAAGLFILTFIAVPLNIIIPPQLAIEIVEKKLLLAYQGPGLNAAYLPKLAEWLVVLFAMAFGALVFLVGHYILVRRINHNNPVKEG